MKSHGLNLDGVLDELFDYVVVVDGEFRVFRANEAYAKTFGYSADETPGRHCYEIAAGRNMPCEQTGGPCPVIEVFETGRPFRSERNYKDAHGRLVRVEVRAIPLENETGRIELVAVILRDITEWKRIEEKFVESFQNLQQMSDASEDAIFLVDSDLQVGFVNQRASDLTGRSKKELVSLNLQLLLHTGGKDFFNRLRSEIESGEPIQLRRTMKLATTSQNFLDCEVWFTKITGGGKNDLLYVFVRDLSEQRLMANEFRRTNEFLINLIESSVDGIIAADMKGTAIIFNKGAESLLGYNPEEVVGKFSVADFYPTGVAQEIMRKLRSDKYGGTGKVLPHMITGIHKNGEHIPVSLSGALIYEDGVEVASMGIFYDLREIQKAEKDLHESESNFLNLFERVQLGIYFSTRDGKFIDCNLALINMLEYENKEELLTKELARDVYFDPEDRSKFQEMIERDGQVKDYEVSFKKKNGDPVTVMLTAHLRKDPSGEVIGYQGIVVDITERRKLEQQLFQSEKLASMGRLTAQIAHELNNPIYGVMNCLDLIKSEIPVGNKKRKFLDMAYSETERISQLLRNMLKFFRPTEDVKAPIDLNDLVEEVILFLGKQLNEFRIKPVLELDTDIPKIFASGNQLKQVLLNMIMNAKNAMPNGGVLTLSSHCEDGSVLLKIADTGVGIPAENMNQIFDAFFTTKSDVKGVGLGLSVCFGIIKEHGGEIRAESEVGVGTTFIISLLTEL